MTRVCSCFIYFDDVIFPKLPLKCQRLVSTFPIVALLLDYFHDVLMQNRIVDLNIIVLAEHVWMLLVFGI